MPYYCPSGPLHFIKMNAFDLFVQCAAEQCHLGDSSIDCIAVVEYTSDHHTS